MTLRVEDSKIKYRTSYIINQNGDIMLCKIYNHGGGTGIFACQLL